jgi:hypothetical protein
MKRPARIPSQLSDSLHRHLNAYALAASTAGVGLLALVQPAEARIVYTPVHHVIGKNSSFRIDLNHDGIADLLVYNSQFISKSGGANFIRAEMQDSGGIIGSNQYYFVSFVALKPGARVGYGDPFLFPQTGHGILIAQCDNPLRTSSAPPCATSNTFHTSGHWANVKNRYLGLTFPIKGKNHYAWVRLSVEVSRKPFKATAILTGYAYETIPNKAIVAGRTKGPDVAIQPASLGRLAQGSAGLAARRQKQ